MCYNSDVKVILKKKELGVLKQAYAGDSIMDFPADNGSIFWRKTTKSIAPSQFQPLIDLGLMAWTEYPAPSCRGSEAFITDKGNQLFEDLGLCSLTHSK